MKTFFIGEIGINHNGSLKTALRLIKECKEAGVSVVKFQKRTPEICVPENQKTILRDTPWGQMMYIDYKKRIEFDKKQYDLIDLYCKKIGIKWTASVWDIPSFHFINQYDVPFIKIPSAKLTDWDLLKVVNRLTKSKVILSTGMSTIEEIKKASTLLQDTLFSLLLCNSSYPSKDSEIDINALRLLKEVFPQKIIGYSGHEVDILPTIVAVSAGAEIIERHVTLNKEMWGTDQKSSLTTEELRNLIKCIRRVEIILGQKEIVVYPDEYKAKERLRA